MPSKKTTDGSEAVVQALRSGLQELGDVNLVDDLEHSELVDTLGEGGFGVAELRRVPGNEDRSAGEDRRTDRRRETGLGRGQIHRGAEER